MEYNITSSVVVTIYGGQNLLRRGTGHRNKELHLSQSQKRTTSKYTQDNPECPFGSLTILYITKQVVSSWKSMQDSEMKTMAELSPENEGNIMIHFDGLSFIRVLLSQLNS